VGKRFTQAQEAYKDSNILCTTEELIDWKYLKYYKLIGNRQVPYLLQSIGALAKKILLAVRNLGR
jgi:hypothetical protein